MFNTKMILSMRGVHKILLEIHCCWRRERNVSFLCRLV